MVDVFSFSAVFFAALAGSFRAGQRTLHFTGAVITGILSGLAVPLARDLPVNRGISAIFMDQNYLASVLLGGCLGFLLCKRLGRSGGLRAVFATLESCSLGLGSALGLAQGLVLGLPVAGCILLGIAVGIAGGLIRDLCLAETPLTITADFHFMASGIGVMAGFALAASGFPLLWAAALSAVCTALFCLFGFWRRGRNGQADLDY